MQIPRGKRHFRMIGTSKYQKVEISMTLFRFTNDQDPICKNKTVCERDFLQSGTEVHASESESITSFKMTKRNRLVQSIKIDGPFHGHHFSRKDFPVTLEMVALYLY